ncbi:MAG: GNAT family N-acetyltransferase, partial [Pseudomonadota bacterium]
MSNLIIRGVEQTEEAEWRRLWTGYLEFYDSSVDAAVYPSTFGRFFSDDPYDPRCLVAELDGALVGLVHFFQHRHAWRLENVVYLQDLFADPEVRGEGVGRKLIE